ncbi:MAG: hypothetical protein JW828_06710 [Sedimentisphaerales bacterium]|nr:hypothetical protein [Sedimentisphaerales bacterium]
MIRNEKEELASQKMLFMRFFRLPFLTLCITVFGLSLVHGQTDIDKRGFVQVAASHRYFQWEDGTAFFPIGQNDWPEMFDLRKRTREDLAAYFQNLRRHGVNILRLLMDVGVQKDVMWVETSPGHFNPAFKKWMDTIIELARLHDVYLIIALYPNLIEGPTGNWRFYPYSKTADGFLEEPFDMVVSAEAVVCQKRRFRYFVDNWGASPCIFSWELFNEFWLPSKRSSVRETIQAHNRWIEEMGSYAKNYEMKMLGRHHLRSVSCMRSEFPADVRGLKTEDTTMFQSPHLDFTSYHGYGRQLRGAQNVTTNFGLLQGNRIEPDRLILSIHETVNFMLSRSPDRPILCTEDFQFANPQAASYRNPMNPIRKMLRDYTDEERYDLFLAANWSFLMSGAAGPTMRYPMEFFEDGLYRTYGSLSAFSAMVPWSRFDARPAHDKIETDRADLIGMAMSDGRYMIAWLYHDVSFEARQLIQPHVTFLGLGCQSCLVTWFDSRNGKILRKDNVRQSFSNLKVPAFQGHVACFVEPSDNLPGEKK